MIWEMQAMKITTNGPEETEAFAEKLGKSLAPGTVLALFGDLGAGKTTFVRGLARGLGVTGGVSSPTYTIVNEYPGPVPLFHFDMYRLGSSDELFEIGWEDYLNRDGVMAVEWSERVADAFDGDEVCVYLEKGEGDTRIIAVEGASV